MPEKGRLQWWSFGKPRPNFAFVSAARTSRDGADRCLLEIANLSEDRGSSTLTIETAGDAPQRSVLALAAGQTKRIILQLKPDTPALRAYLEPDALAIDNEVILLPSAGGRPRCGPSGREGTADAVAEGDQVGAPGHHYRNATGADLYRRP